MKIFYVFCMDGDYSDTLKTIFVKNIPPVVTAGI